VAISIPSKEHFLHVYGLTLLNSENSRSLCFIFQWGLRKSP